MNDCTSVKGGSRITFRVRRALLAPLFVLVAIVLGCGRGSDRAVPDGSTITVLHPGDERALGPYWDMSGQFLVFLPLAVTNGDGELEGQLAERWEHSADYREWTYHLRRDVRWQDGIPVTAHDVAFSMELQSLPEVALVSPDLFQSIEVLDDHTLRVVYRKPEFQLDDWTTYYPRHLLQDLDPTELFEWEFWTHPVGNGPYRYVRHVPKTMIELEANPDYFRGKPRIERVVLQLGGGTTLVELLSGGVQAASFVNRSDLAKLVRERRFAVYHGHCEGCWLSAIHWNHRHPALGDLEVRRALTHAIDRRQLIQALYLPDDLPIIDVIHTNRQFRRGEFPKPLPYDPDLARRLLDEAGWRDTDGDGIRDRDGVRLRFGAMVTAEGGYEGNAMPFAAVLVQEAFWRIGVQMEISSLEASVVRQRVRSGDFEAAFLRFWNAPRGHLQWFGPDAPIGYYNPALAALLLEASNASDPGQQDSIYGDIMKIFREDLPITILFPQVFTYVADRRLKGLSSPYRADPVRYLQYLWWGKN